MASASASASAASVPQTLAAKSLAGQLDGIVAGLRGIVGVDGLPDAAVAAARKAHAAASMPVVRAESGAWVVMCEEGCVGEGQYVDSKSGTVVAVDMVSGKVTGTGSADASGVLGAAGTRAAEVRAALAAAAEAEAAALFQDKGRRHGAGEAYVRGDDIVMVLSGVFSNPTSFQAAQWRSRWTLSGVGASPVLAGRIEAVTHYFEGGNVQLRGSYDVDPAPLRVGADAGPEAVAKAVMAAASEAETAYQHQLTMELAMARARMVPALRRGLPRSHTKMEWNVMAHRLVSALAEPNDG